MGHTNVRNTKSTRSSFLCVSLRQSKPNECDQYWIKSVNTTHCTHIATAKAFFFHYTMYAWMMCKRQVNAKIVARCIDNTWLNTTKKKTTTCIGFGRPILFPTKSYIACNISNASTNQQNDRKSKLDRFNVLLFCCCMLGWAYIARNICFCWQQISSTMHIVIQLS